jgi:hypothetical protein
MKKYFITFALAVSAMAAFGSLRQHVSVAGIGGSPKPPAAHSQAVDIQATR